MREGMNPIIEKYAKIDFSGRKALEAGAIEEFKGFGENLKNDFGAVVLFDSESEAIIKEKILTKITEMSKELGIELLVAGTDFPLHSTLLLGRNEQMDEEERKKIFEAISKDVDVTTSNDSLSGEKLEYKYLLLDKSNVLLTCIQIPGKIDIIRKKLESIYKKFSLKPLPMENILHISIARIAKLPETDQNKVLEEYEKKMIRIRHQISSNPLELKISEIFSGSTYNFFTKKI